jgi:folate-binding protein YgfZ
VTTQDPSLPSGCIARLVRRGVVAVSGADAEKFLNDLVTADASAAGGNRAVYAGLLTPQAKVLFDFIIFRSPDGFQIDVLRDKAAELIKRLGFYRLRANVAISDRSEELHVLAGWDGAPPAMNGLVAPDPRLSDLGWRAVTPVGAVPNATEADYDAHRLALGVPEGGIDFGFGEVFPHDADLDQVGGVDFTKGCYVGQEVVSRMEHRHTARRRIIAVTATGKLPARGTDVVAGGKPLGVLGSSADRTGLALVRLDRAKDAMDRGEPITAEGVSLTLTIPGWARFIWPTAVDAGDA